MSTHEHTMRVNYIRHGGQQEALDLIMNSPADVFVINAARGVGKSIFCTCDLVLPKLCSSPYTQVQWIAPTYKICRAPIDDVWKGVDEATGKRFVPQYTDDGFKLWEFNKGDMEIKMHNNSVMYCRSADNPESIVAKGYSLIIIDEGAIIKEDVFMQHILPTARRANCKIVIISTPRGKNWFYKLHQAGQDRSQPEFASLTLPWWKRPDYPMILQRLMKKIPEHIRRQEFDAEFIGDGGSVFRNLSRVFKGPEISFNSEQQEWLASMRREELNGEEWTIGVDIAKEQDYTVIMAVGNTTRRTAYYSRRNKEDYDVVVEKIKRVAAYFNDADVIYDATGVGAGVGDFLDRDINAYPFKFTNESKSKLIGRLIVGCDTGEIAIPNIITAKSEFEGFAYELSKTGKLIYNAPSGKHDDIVIAAALANWYIHSNEGKATSHEVDNFLDDYSNATRPKSEFEQFLDED